MSTMVQNLENELIKQSVKVFTPVNFAWTSGANRTHFGIAAKIPLALPASIAVEVNNSRLARVGYTLTPRLTVKLTFLW